jgi:hypothetical protein
MRRIVSIMLMLVLGLPMFASAFAGAQASTVALCCRKGGMHRCMEMGSEPVGAAKLRAVCPVFPRGVSTVPTTVAMMLPRFDLAVRRSIKPVSVGRVDDGYQIALGPSRWNRGPPLHNS